MKQPQRPGLSGGLHVVDITDNKGCTTSATVNIDEPGVLEASAAQDNPVVCNGESNGAATVTVTGGNLPYSYSWDDGETTATASNLSAGLHVVDITDNKGCITSATVNIEEPDVLTATAVQDNPVECSGDSNGGATVTAEGGNGGYSYLWDDNETGATATGLNDGVHTVTVTDSKGCSFVASVTISTKPNPTISLSSPRAQITRLFVLIMLLALLPMPLAVVRQAPRLEDYHLMLPALMMLTQACSPSVAHPMYPAPLILQLPLQGHVLIHL